MRCCMLHRHVSYPIATCPRRMLHRTQSVVACCGAVSATGRVCHAACRPTGTGGSGHTSAADSMLWSPPSCGACSACALAHRKLPSETSTRRGTAVAAERTVVSGRQRAAGGMHHAGAALLARVHRATYSSVPHATRRNTALAADIRVRPALALQHRHHAAAALCDRGQPRLR